MRVLSSLRSLLSRKMRQSSETNGRTSRTAISRNKNAWTLVGDSEGGSGATRRAQWELNDVSTADLDESAARAQGDTI